MIEKLLSEFFQCGIDFGIALSENDSDKVREAISKANEIRAKIEDLIERKVERKVNIDIDFKDIIQRNREEILREREKLVRAFAAEKGALPSEIELVENPTKMELSLYLLGEKVNV